MRRPRPKSYVLATSSTYDDFPSPAATATTFSSDDLSASSVCPSPSVDLRPTQPRLARLISLFHNDENAKQPSPRSLSIGKLPLKRARTTGTVHRHSLPPLAVRQRLVCRQGPLLRQERLGNRKSQWPQYWALLSQQRLYLCTQLSSYVSDDTLEKMLSVPGDAECIEVANCLSEIAYDQRSEGRYHVLRILTQDNKEHLFQAETESEMLDWISSIQYSSQMQLLSDGHSAYSTGSLASSSSVCSDLPRSTHNDPQTLLIMHRYKTKSSQLSAASPLSSGKKAGHGSDQQQPGTSTDGEGTPKSGRKWKRSKAAKQGSGGSQGSASAAAAASAFGHRITDCQTSGDGDLVPLLVQLCVGVVETHGMETVGIYRIPGNTAAVNALKETLSQGLDQDIDYADPKWKDVNVVSSLLKMFLRKLPEPLLTDKLYPFFIDASRIANHSNRLHKLRNLLRKLPRAHYSTLKFIVCHLAEVTSHSDVNKMETRNLALMFGPSIVRPSDDNMATMVTHMSEQCKIIETFINYCDWMFDDAGTAEDAVPPPAAGDWGGAAPAGSDGPPGVSSATFNDMHNLIRRANEDQAAAMMSDRSAGGRIKSMLNVRRNSRRDKSKSKIKIESTAPAVTDPQPHGATPMQGATAAARARQPSQHASLDSAFCGHYQERDIDAEIASRRTVSPLASNPGSQAEDTCSQPEYSSHSQFSERSPSRGSSLASLDTARTEPLQDIKRRQQDLYSARRIFIAGADAAVSEDAMDALASHTQHLHLASTPALEVLSAETREKIKRLQRGQPNWQSIPSATRPSLRPSPTRDSVDALSCTSDYSTTSSLPTREPVSVSVDPVPASSDYASSDVSPAILTGGSAKVSPLPRSPAPHPVDAPPPQRPDQLPVDGSRLACKIRMRHKGKQDKARRHTLSDMDGLAAEVARGGGSGAMSKITRWLRHGLRKSSPDVSQAEPAPPVIVRTSPAELTPASGDELL